MINDIVKNIDDNKIKPIIGNNLDQIKYLDAEIKYIEEEIKYWNTENELKSSENKKNIINKLTIELSNLKDIYLKMLNISNKK